MSPLARFPFVRFVLFFMLGIWAGMYGLVSSLSVAISLFTALFFLYIIVFLLKRRYRSIDPHGFWIGMIGLAAFGMVGIIRVLQYSPELDTNHIMHCADSIEAYQGVIEEHVSTARHDRLTLSVQRVYRKGRWEYATGKVWVWLSCSSSFRYGDTITIEGRISVIRRPRNPYTFDYRRFAAQQGVFHQAFVSLAQVTWRAYVPPNKWLAAVYHMRSYFACTLRAQLQDDTVQALVLALMLGIRAEMEEDIRSDFSAAGISHILAVSGLHVGILYAILFLFLSLIGAIGSRRRWLQAMIILSVLWGYALITALSASVVRAVTMFSLLTIGRLCRRRYNFWNALSTTAFGALFYQPLWLTQIGFQLSYLAVMGIGIVFPMLEGLFKPAHSITKKVWSLTALSLSVQIATLPISLYYFHYFPTYFLLGNSIAIPAASVILVLGVAVCAIGALPWVGSYIGWLLTMVVSSLYQYAAWLARLPYSQIGPFWYSLYEVVLAYGMMMSLVAFFIRKKFRYLPIATACAVGLGGLAFYRGYGQRKQQEAILYSLPQGKALSLIEGRHALILLDSHLSKSVCYTREISPSIEALGIQRVTLLPFEQGAYTGDQIRYTVWKGLKIVIWKEKKVVWLDKSCFAPPLLTTPWKVDILVVDHYHPGHFASWLSCLHPTLVVIGGSLQAAQRRRLMAFLTKEGIPFHDLMREGAIRIPH